MESEQSSLLSSPASSALPSSPLSVLSNSPSLPSSPTRFDPSNRYPSPSSSTPQSGSASPIKSSQGPSRIQICVRTDGPPPAKKRKVSTPKQPRTRTTEYLDMENADDNGEQEALFARLMTALRKKKRIVVIAGAGISVSAGIPDFRSSTGLFTTLRGQHKLKASGKHLFDASVYKDDSSTSSFHTMVRELAAMTEKAQPTPFHHMLASLAHEGRLMRLYSQNVDCLDTGMKPLATQVPLSAKGPWPTTIQLHGGLDHMVCSKCGEIEDFDSSRFDGPEPPPCAKCEALDNVRTSFAGKRSHGIGRLRPRIVLYNEYNPDEEAIGMVSKADLRRVPDAVIVVGTSLKIPGVRRIVREMCHTTRSRRDGFTAWLNIDPEPQGADFKGCWDIVVKGKCDDVAELVNLPRWDQQVDDEQEGESGKRSWEVTPDAEETKHRRHQKNPVVNITPAAEPASAKSLRFAQLAEQTGIPTPSASPRLESIQPPAGAVAARSTASGPSKTKQSRLLFVATKPGTAVDEGTQKEAKKRKEPAAAPRATSASKAGQGREVTPMTPTKPKKSGGSAPKRKKPAGQAKLAAITTSFRTTKADSFQEAGAPVKKEASPAPSPKFPASSPLFSNTFPFRDDQPEPVEPLDLSQLPALRPSLPKKWSGAGGDENSRPSSSATSSLRLHTPPPQTGRHERTASQDTISPTSKPHGLSHLID